MAKAYPTELRQRVLAACDDGLKTRAVAKLFRVSESWVRRIKQRRREEGRTTAKPMGGATVFKIDLPRLRQLVQAQPDATLEELQRRLDGTCSCSGIWKALGRLGLSFKKKRSMRRNKSARTWLPPAPSGNSISPPSTPAG
jgi:transposase